MKAQQNSTLDIAESMLWKRPVYCAFVFPPGTGLAITFHVKGHGLANTFHVKGHI